MRVYYDRRAPEYDDWYTGSGSFSSRERPGWDEELAALLRLVEGLSPARTLDLGCGTGYLTRHLRGPVVGCDQSAAMLSRARTQAPGVPLVRGDALALPFADAAFERLFTAHLYGHVPPEDRAGFLDEARAVAGEIVMVDAGPRGGLPRDQWEDRVLRDGSRHRVYKRFFTGASLAAELVGGRVQHDGYWFVAVVAAGGGAVRGPAPQQGFGD
jgi:demethylmenaquinone methyltransferase/2-methoxy-6-polyprenyl-1,4-benzoquinol methylase